MPDGKLSEEAVGWAFSSGKSNLKKKYDSDAEDDKSKVLEVMRIDRETMNKHTTHLTVNEHHTSINYEKICIKL